MSITIKEIAGKSGFGYGTVVRALSGKGQPIKEETRKKILKVAQKYNYVKDLTAQALVTKKTNDIGLVMPAKFKEVFYQDYYLKALSGIMDELSSTEYRLRIILLREQVGFKEIAQETKSLKLRGLIVLPYIQKFFIDEKVLHKLGIPVVVIVKK